MRFFIAVEITQSRSIGNFFIPFIFLLLLDCPAFFSADLRGFFLFNPNKTVESSYLYLYE